MLQGQQSQFYAEKIPTQLFGKILEKLEGEKMIFLHTKKAKRAELEKT